MGIFGSSGDTGGLNLGTSGDYGSKLRSSSEFDSSGTSLGAPSTLDLAGGDFEKGTYLLVVTCTMHVQNCTEILSYFLSIYLVTHIILVLRIGHFPIDKFLLHWPGISRTVNL